MTEDEPRRRPIIDGLEVDLDGSYVIFGDGSSAGVDGDYACGVLPEAQIRPLPLTGLDAALGAIVEDEGADWGTDIWVVDTDPPNRIYDVEAIDGLALCTANQGGLCALISIGLPRYVDEEFEGRVADLLAPMMARVAGSAKAPFHPPDAFFDSGDFIVMVEFNQMSGRTVGELLDVALAVQAFLKAARAGEFNRTVARDLLRAGHFRALLGQPENVWLEAKDQSWDLGTDSGKAEAAKDLSALANAAGGLVVMPARTSGHAGEDVITEVKAMPADRFSETQLRDTIARWIFPPLPAVEIDVIDAGDERVQVVIAVPTHRPQDWPHLVVGDENAAFSRAAVAGFVRDGAKNRALSAPELHQLMRGGGTAAAPRGGAGPLRADDTRAGGAGNGTTTLHRPSP